MKIEMGKKYTSNGKLVRILCVDRPCTDYPVISMDDDGYIRKFDVCGRYEQSWAEYDLVEVFEPKEGEWCLFWDDYETKNAALTKFVGMSKSGMFQSCGNINWKYCAKFDGTLPEHLKECKNENN
jgi:hypothetical protein